MGTKATTTGNGKGGNFATRKNPFTQTATPRNRPSLADNSSIGLALDAVLGAECAIIIGSTRDGGALVLTILDGDERHRTYCSNEGELDEAVSVMLRLYTSP